MRATNGNYVIAGLLLACSVATHAQDLAATLGKQRAAGSRVEWEIREAGHPALGKLAIELSNAMAPADPAGLRPASEPRLICNRPTGSGDKVEREEILATWTINEKIGDALTQGLRPFPLRECAAISVVQEVTMPAGSAQKTARIEFELLPYNRELDSIFVTCGERSAYGPGSTAPAVATAPATGPTVAASQKSPPAQPKPAQATDASWQSARAVPVGMTNLRSGPTLQSPIVVQLYPGAVVQAQRAAGDWWRVRAKTPKGAVVEGYIREDRLVFKK